MKKKKTTKKKVTKKQSSGNRRAALQEWMGQINSPEHRVIAFADQVPNTYELRRPSRIMQLDLDTGGGLPAGGLSYLTGPDNAGKTDLLYHYFTAHQKLFGEESCIGYAAVEGGFDFKRARQVGVQIAIPDLMIEQWEEERTLRGQEPFTEEELLGFKKQVGDFVIIQGDTGEEILQAVLGAVKTNLFGIVAVDSVSALRPEADAAKDLEEYEKRAARANLITKFMKHYMPLTNTLNGLNYTTLIFTQQVRANQERANAPAHMQPYIKRYEATGAWAGKHGKLIDICVSSGQKIKKQIKGTKYTIGKVLKWELEKGKAGTHDNINGEAPFIYPEFGGVGVDTIESLIIAAIRHGVISESGDKSVYLNGVVPQVPMAPNLKTLTANLEQDFELELQLRREVLAAKGVTCLYR